MAQITRHAREPFENTVASGSRRIQHADPEINANRVITTHRRTCEHIVRLNVSPWQNRPGRSCSRDPERGLQSRPIVHLVNRAQSQQDLQRM